MSVAEKYTTLTAEKIPQVHAKAYENGHRDGYDNARAANESAEKQAYADGWSEGNHLGLKDGEEEERLRFWNSNQKNGTETYYTYHYAGNGWTDEIYDPPYPITATKNANYMFCGSWITDTKVPITLGANGNHYRLFYGANKLRRICGLTVARDTKFDNSSFQGCTALTTIDNIEGRIGNSINFKDAPLSLPTMKLIINRLYKYANTSEDLTHTLTFSTKCWTVLERSPTPSINFGGGIIGQWPSWRSYIESELGWLTA